MEPGWDDNLNSDGFISGIHNYCDYWCERCTMAVHCAIYDDQQGKRRRSDSIEEENRRFWKDLLGNLEEALELAQESARDMGIDPDELVTPEYLAEIEAEDAIAEQDEIIQSAWGYFVTVSDWLKQAEPVLEAKEEELNQKLQLAFPDVNPEQEAEDIIDCLEVIQWDHTFINSKVNRAVRGKIHGDEDIMEEWEKDSNGSAKIALLSIERSIAAWMKLRRYFPEHRDELLGFLLTLNRMREGLLRDFPNAMLFKRPGFDD